MLYSFHGKRLVSIEYGTDYIVFMTDVLLVLSMVQTIVFMADVLLVLSMV